jgi:hypothetical protein
MPPVTMVTAWNTLAPFGPRRQRKPGWRIVRLALLNTKYRSAIVEGELCQTIAAEPHRFFYDTVSQSGADFGSRLATLRISSGRPKHSAYASA